MTNASPLGKYRHGNSVIHKLDARVKILSSVLIFSLIFWVQSFFSLALCLGFMIFITLLTRVPFTEFLKSSKYIIIISLFTVAINLAFEMQTHFVKSGSAIPSFTIFKNSVAVFLRLVTIVIISLVVTFTTSAQSISHALENIMQPLKYIGINPQETAMTTVIALRFFPILFEQTQKIITSQKARGADFGNKNPIKKIKSYSKIIMPLFATSFKSAENLAIAMESRCYDSRALRTSYKETTLKKLDIFAIAFILIITMGVIFCEKMMIF